MKRSILIPTDFSDNAWSAIIYALKLYADEFCTFYLLHTSHLSNPVSRTYITSHYVQKTHENAKKELIELKNQVEQSNVNANHDFQTILSSKPLLDTIKTTLKKHPIDLIVMGTKGATGINKFFMGSNTVDLIKNINQCPILAVPDQYEFSAPSRIAFPTDFNRFYDYLELKPLLDFADLFNSHIYVLHINVEKKLNELQEYNMTMLKEHLKNFKHSFHWLPKYTKKTEEINVFIEDLKIDVLAMINYEHSIIENIIKEPIIKKIGFKPIVPFLVFPE